MSCILSSLDTQYVDFAVFSADDAGWQAQQLGGYGSAKMQPDEGQAEGQQEQMQGKKLRCTRCSRRRSGR